MGSPVEDGRVSAQKCIEVSTRMGAKNAAVACVVSTVATLLAVRKIPWAKANINHTGQALIISAASISTYFITVDKNILRTQKKNARYDKPT